MLSGGANTRENLLSNPSIFLETLNFRNQGNLKGNWGQTGGIDLTRRWFTELQLAPQQIDVIMCFQGTPVTGENLKSQNIP